MAKSREGKDKETLRQPLRPAFSGAAISFCWGAFNVPTTTHIVPLLAFGGEIIALAIGCAGAVILSIEIIAFAIRSGAVLRGYGRSW